MNAENGDWTDDASNRFCWAASGSELLVQHFENIRILDASNELREKRAFEFEDGVVIGLGWFGDDWWLVLKQDDGVFFQRGMQGERQRLVGAERKLVSRPTLSPDGRILACAVAEGAIWLWSVLNGERMSSLRFDLDDDHREIFGAPEIARLSWAPNSQYLAVGFSFPLEQIAVIDVLDRRIVGILDL